MSGFHLSLSRGVVSCRFITLCVCVACDVCVVLGSSLVFLAFLLCDDGKKRSSYLSYHNTFHRLSFFLRVSVTNSLLSAAPLMLSSLKDSLIFQTIRPALSVDL